MSKNKILVDDNEELYINNRGMIVTSRKKINNNNNNSKKKGKSDKDILQNLSNFLEEKVLNFLQKKRLGGELNDLENKEKKIINLNPKSKK